jgi:hypothetical protein
VQVAEFKSKARLLRVSLKREKRYFRFLTVFQHRNLGAGTHTRRSMRSSSHGQSASVCYFSIAPT